MATTTHDEGFHEIQLNGKQLVFLFMAGTVVAVVIFLLGVFVGRGVRSVGGGDPLAMVEQGQTPEAPDVPAVSGSTGGGPPATANEDLNYPALVTGENAKEKLDKPQASSEKTASNAPSQPAPATPPAAVPAPSASVTREPAPAVASAVPAEPAGDGFAIQLAALGKRDEAEGIVRRLANKGYAAYLMAPEAGKVQVYRVRVGKFKDRREAESVSTRLQKEEQFKPWIVR